nr:UBA [Hymenolepis microstoma]
MDYSNSEIDAQLLEQFRCLGTNDRDESLPKAIGAYYDFNFESNIDAATSPTSTVTPQSQMYDARHLPSPHSGPKQKSPLIWCVQNTGTSSWPDGCYLTVELNLSTISNCDNSVVWLPVPAEFRKPLSELTPGSFAHLVVDIPFPTDDIRHRLAQTNIPIVGAFKLCLPNGDRFGELLYCSIIPDMITGSFLFRAGTPDMPILPPEPHCGHDPSSVQQQPMEEDL